MPTSLLIGAGLILGGVGLYEQHQGLNQQKDASNQMAQAQTDEINQQKKVEADRQKQMDLDYKRQQLQILRDTQRARSVSLAVSTSQGINQGSSILSGSYAGESGASGTQQLALNQNYSIGQDIFGLNQNISDARIRYANAQSAYQVGGANAGMGAGLTSLGGAFITSAGTLGSSMKSGYSMAQNNLSFGTGPGSWSGGRTS